MWCRNELLLLGILGPVTLSDLRAKYDTNIYSSDASPFGIGVTSVFVGERVAKELWRRADIAGRSRVLLHKISAELKEVGIDNWEDTLAADDMDDDEAGDRQQQVGILQQGQNAGAHGSLCRMRF